MLIESVGGYRDETCRIAAPYFGGSESLLRQAMYPRNAQMKRSMKSAGENGERLSAWTERLQDESLPPAQHRVKVLAEIMRLRRACCNPNRAALRPQA